MERRAIAIQGTVQGVGFRPFVYSLASQLNLYGFVRNLAGGVEIEVEGETPSLDQFLLQLTGDPPPLARIEDLNWQRRSPRGDRAFRIESSRGDASGSIAVSPDVATCDDCLAELFDPADRRFGYPFLNCTNCGPRLTIIAGAPYDRERTTMAGFAMCPACRAEFEDPTNRRFHAQSTCCPVCGPRLAAADGEGNAIKTPDPFLWFAGQLRQGKIGAIKGLGGYHLVCLAEDDAAVAELRRRKRREEKPFAVMVGDLDAAALLCDLDAVERQFLRSAARPVVLLPRRSRAAIADAVAPKNPLLGLMLPYTPLHHLLLKAVNGAPLVMTSGNQSDEPIAIDEPDVFQKLGGIADVFLTHNRPIHVRCDDSVTRVFAGSESPVRRSRGYAPQPLNLPFCCPEPILAVGGQLKATFALGDDRRAILSHHLGDLDHFQAARAFERDVTLYEQLFALSPRRIAYDLHPDYASTRYALERIASEQLIGMAVQHHHAHMASCMAEHGLDEPVIGVAFDGTGFGTDQTLWGGEFFVGDYCQFRRAAHLRYVGLPGGEQAIREPWRTAVAHLKDAEANCDALNHRLPGIAVRTTQRMIERNFNTPMSSSAGRLFDVVACLAGVRDRVSYEGQAAIELERLAQASPPDCGYPIDIQEPAATSDDPAIVDTRPLIRSVVADVARGAAPAVIARRFHSAMAEAIGLVCNRLRQVTGLNAVVLSGGVFMNALLTCQAFARLSADGFRVYRHQKVPPNDGGLSLGQLAVAARHAALEKCSKT